MKASKIMPEIATGYWQLAFSFKKKPSKSYL